MLAFGYTLLVVIVALAIPLAINLRARARGELESQALLSAQTIAAGLGKEGMKEGPVLNHQVAAYAQQIHGRVIVVDPDGTVLADSLGNASVGDNYADCGRPEILSALGLRCVDPATNQLAPAVPKSETTIRHSTDLDADILAAAAPVLDEGRVFGAVRITQDIGPVNAAVRSVTIGIVAVGVAGLIAGMVVAFALANSLSRPLTRLAATARRLGSGDFSARAGHVGGAQEIDSLGDSFDEMADRVERTVRAQREFVANASHQLRTPLTGMKLRLEAAGADTDDPAVGEQIRAADQEVDRMADTIDRMLVAAREIEEGHASVVHLQEIAERAVDRWRERAERASTSVTASGADGEAMADPVDLEQVVDNLIDNALAHGAGPVEIETRADADHVRLSVRDHGAGIPEAEQEHVTDRFFRGDATDAEGTGLGLAIARELAERWGGDLTVSNDVGGGARVELRLPAAGPAPR